MTRSNGGSGNLACRAGRKQAAAAGLLFGVTWPSTRRPRRHWRPQRRRFRAPCATATWVNKSPADVALPDGFGAPALKPVRDNTATTCLPCSSAPRARWGHHRSGPWGRYPVPATATAACGSARWRRHCRGPGAARHRCHSGAGEIDGRAAAPGNEQLGVQCRSPPVAAADRTGR